MALRKPLVIVSGKLQQIGAPDTLDATISNPEVLTLVNGETTSIVIGSPVYISAADTVKLGNANASGTVTVIGVVSDASIANGASGAVKTDGVQVATTTQWDAVTGGSGGLTVGTTYYLDTATAGKLTSTAPSTVGQFIMPVGQALSTTELLLLKSAFGAIGL